MPRMARKQAQQPTQQDPTRIFISWTEGPSKAVALALYQWLPNVIQALKPWMSREKIQAGARWNAEVSGELEICHTGILCLTRENQREPWLNFEAGALGKNVGVSRVCVYLLDGMTPSEVIGPLGQFQMKAADEAGTLDILRSINDGLGESARLSPDVLRGAFEKWWTQLDAQIRTAFAGPRVEPTKPDPAMLLTEILDTVRALRPAPDILPFYSDLDDRLAAVESKIESLELERDEG